MKKNYDNMNNGYAETVNNGIRAVGKLSRKMHYAKGAQIEEIMRLKKEIQSADAIVIGAGAGLSTSAGFTYSGERLQKYFGDFVDKYDIQDMYSGGFMVAHFAPEINWAYWARYIYINRYLDAPKPVYSELFELVKDKDYFVITTNVDHQFQKAGFDEKRLFFTQGDYGLFQTVDGENGKTYDNEKWVMQAMKAQGFVENEKGEFSIPENGKIKMVIPTEMIPKSPDDGSDVAMNLRVDSSFVEDENWHLSSARYFDYLHSHDKKHVLYLELGVGSNTPVIVKYPFWQMTLENENAVYACINYGESFCPREIKDRSICIDGDIGEIIEAVK